MSALTQIQKAIKDEFSKIGIDVAIKRVVDTVDDGLGNQVPNPYGTPVTVYRRVIFSRAASGPFDLNDLGVEMNSNMARMIKFQVGTDIVDKDRFDIDGKTWIVNLIDPVRFGDTVIEYQAVLKESE